MADPKKFGTRPDKDWYNHSERRKRDGERVHDLFREYCVSSQKRKVHAFKG